jgi:hypothetical protein
MARANVTAQAVGAAGLSLTMTGPAVAPDGDRVPLGANTFLVVRNGSGAPINVTVDTTLTADGLVVPDRVLAVAAGAVGMVPLDPQLYAQTSGADAGYGYVDYSAVTTVTRAVVRL